MGTTTRPAPADEDQWDVTVWLLDGGPHDYAGARTEVQDGTLIIREAHGTIHRYAPGRWAGTTETPIPATREESDA